MVFVAAFIVIIGLSQANVLQIPPVLDALMMVGAIGLFVGGLASQIYRYYRRSGAIEKQQTKWIIAAIGLFVLSIFVGLSNLLFWGPQQRGIAAELLGSIVLAPIFSLASAALPLSVGIAILRYRLWDIDVIVRRTVTYAIVSAALAIVYFGANIVAQGVIGALGGQRNEVAIVASTLAVAALFSPVRRRVQNAIDRRFNRQRYDPDKVVADFAEYAAKETNLAALQARIVGVVAETIQPKQVSLWVRGNSVTLSERSSARLDSDL
jgi:cation transporter-like permease